MTESFDAEDRKPEMPEPFDAGDHEQVKKRARFVKRLRMQDVENWRRVLRERYSRDVIWRILGMCGIYNAPPTHPQDTFRAVGRQDVGRMILEEVFTADPEAYMLMQIEHRDDDDEEEMPEDA